MVVVSEDVLAQFPRFSLYNSPYAAHEAGCAIDLYPQNDASPSPRATAAPSPVAGEVVATRTVSAPSQPYAVEHDHLIVVDTGDYLARILHVEPTVEPGDEVAFGDSLGEMVRSGFFAPWVDNHLHLGFRELDANPYRASGSLPVEVGVEVEAVAWDGTGTVVETGDTYAMLDSPEHPAPGERFVGISAGRGGVVLDGGLPHYEGGGALPAVGRSESETVSLAGQRVGVSNSDGDGRTVAWDDLTVLANGEKITGISLCCSSGPFGAKLVCPDVEFEVGEEVSVGIERVHD
ncbi:hypothetical protein [Halorussus halophilus]|uniref:hypothetical protein n=1 Tax=Halorussus halophilus TaxID=2650975 RepID=UPI0013011456|nr:hypothetical protein [Halorussus halophilus]